MNPPVKKKSSGEHPLLAEASRKIDEMNARLIPELQATTERLANAVDQSVAPPPVIAHPIRGGWTLTMRGEGPYHNQDVRDLERIVDEFLGNLAKAGHRVETPQIVFNATDERKPE